MIIFKKNLLLIIFLLFNCCNCTAATPDISIKALSTQKIEDEIQQYMSKIFGVDSPTLKEYYLYEGSHSENEYRYELDLCKKKWGAPTASDSDFLSNIPKECSDWLVSRSVGSEKVQSLYYEHLRTQFNSMPLNYVITSIREDQFGVFVELDVPAEKKRITLFRVQSIEDPELTHIFLKGIKNY